MLRPAYDGSVGLGNLAKAVVISILAAEATPPPPQFTLHHAGGMCRPHISGLGLELSFLVEKEPREVTWHASAQEIFLRHLFSLVLLFFLFLISMGCEDLVYNLGHNLISHFLAQIVPAQAIGCSFGVLLHQAAMSSSGEGCVCV